jgi:hypothetical protein
LIVKDGTISHSTTNLLNGSVDVGSTTRDGLLSFLLIVYLDILIPKSSEKIKILNPF